MDPLLKQGSTGVHLQSEQIDVKVDFAPNLLCGSQTSGLFGVGGGGALLSWEEMRELYEFFKSVPPICEFARSLDRNLCTGYPAGLRTRMHFAKITPRLCKSQASKRKQP